MFILAHNFFYDPPKSDNLKNTFVELFFLLRSIKANKNFSFDWFQCTFVNCISLTYRYPVDCFLLCGKCFHILRFASIVYFRLSQNTDENKKKAKIENNLRIIGICYYSLKKIYAGSFIIPLIPHQCMQSKNLCLYFLLLLF